MTFFLGRRQKAAFVEVRSRFERQLNAFRGRLTQPAGSQRDGKLSKNPSNVYDYYRDCFGYHRSVQWRRSSADSAGIPALLPSQLFHIYAAGTVRENLAREKIHHILICRPMWNQSLNYQPRLAETKELPRVGAHAAAHLKSGKSLTVPSAGL